jgi:hypothetical protein
LLQELELLGWTACRNVEIDVRLGYATAAVKNNSLRPEPPLFSSSAICYVTLRPGVMMAYQETFVQRDQHRIYVRDLPGAEPPIILMHGFPDNVHLYDRLSPYLSPPRRVVLFVGLMGTSAGAFYGYAGFGFDINFGSKCVVTPTAAAGYWYRGGGTNLGSWWEFRTGAEFDYRFKNRSRLGIAFYHMSNAGLTRENQGEQALLLVYTVPLR